MGSTLAFGGKFTKDGTELAVIERTVCWSSAFATTPTAAKWCIAPWVARSRSEESVRRTERNLLRSKGLCAGRLHLQRLLLPLSGASPRGYSA